MLGLVLASLSGCQVALSVRSFCAQAAKCGQLGNVSEDSCVAAWTAELERLNSKGRENCTKLARATQTLFSCRGTLSCQQSADLLTTKCAQANEDWVVASSVAAGECN
ncbi:MAG: hypothetical protein IT380_02200 [Myxococcales bacterium]|nr:hypothetical protein [Myxococcales bacterium]